MAQSAPFDDRDGFIWFDGRLVPWRDAKIHVLTHGLHYASCVFEGERIYDGAVFKLNEHTDRLFNSAKLLDMTIPFTPAQINQATLETVAAQGFRNGYVRPIAWRGSEVMGVTAQASKIHVAIAVWEWPSYFDPAERARGIRLDISPWRRPAPDTAPCDSKCSGLYMICTLSKHAAERKGYADAMMLDYRGYVAEGTGANIFFIKGDEVVTPTPDCFLNGITRQTVMELIRQRGVKLIERHIMPDELEGFEQCFITGTAAEITPVSEIGPYRFKVGALIEALMKDYDRTVRGGKS